MPTNDPPMPPATPAAATAGRSAAQGERKPWQRGLVGLFPYPYNRLLNYISPQAKTILSSIAFMIVTACTASLLALLLGKLTDEGFYGKDAAALWWAPLALIGVSLLHGVSTFASAYLLSLASQRTLVRIRREMFRREIRWPAEVYQKYSSGTVLAKYINEANLALGGASQILITLIRDSLQLLGLLGVLFWRDWRLSCVTFVVAPIVAVIVIWVNRQTKKSATLSQNASGQMMSSVLEAHEGQRIIKIYNAFDRVEHEFMGVNQRLFKLHMRLQLIANAGTPLTQIATMIGVSVVVVVALMQARAGALSLGEFISFLSALLLLMNPVKKLSSLNGSMARITAAAESLFGMMDVPVEENREGRELGRVRGDVRFERVSFSYPKTKKSAVNDISLDVKAGETVAFVGASGAGKTTLINLIPRFLAPSRGEIYFDGVPQSEISLRSLRDQISLVTQDIFLFDDTIEANISYGMEGAAPEDIRRAAEAAHVMSFAGELPDGLRTKVGEAGSRFSGGQKQRISIARALLKDSPILLLDEATSALDTESEKYIQQSLETLMRGRTTFVVAHRLSTIMGADKIVVLEKGNIIEIGRHDDLLARNGTYAHLYNIQFAQKRGHGDGPAPEEATPVPAQP